MPLPLGPSLSGLLLDAVLATSTRSYEERRKDESTTSPPSWSLWGTMPWASAAAAAPTTCHDIGCCLSQVLGSLSPRDLARAQMVCRQWRDVACLPEVRHACFARKWGLAAVHAPEGSHRAWAFLQSINSISCFVRKHMLQPGDTVQSVAVMHGMDVPSIKRLNNMISDSSVTCRTYLYIPGLEAELFLSAVPDLMRAAFKSIEQLAGQVAEYDYCPHSKRSYAVVVSETREQIQQQLQQPPATQGKGQQLQKKMCALLSRSLRIDEESAHYYLEEAGGDMKEAMRMAELDASWEHASGHHNMRRPLLLFKGSG